MMRRLLGLSALALVSATSLAAQASAYPALQPSRIAEREYNFALADGGNGGTALIFQWREGLGSPKMQFTADLGFSDSDGPAATRLIIGGGLARQLATSSDEMPFDIVLAGGLGASFGDDITILKLPVGTVVGHRFALEGETAITPFVHPRLAWSRISGPGLNTSSETDLEIDIGASFELKTNMSIRLAAVLGDNDAVGLSFAWTPKGMR